ncbi:MAG: DUF2164 domain-containing protein [Pseudomonadales bacterium]|nr:MAG: DUF2164 domain-containing protein [Pseudomonadales bacterium]
MSEIKFTRDETDKLVAQLKTYFQDELNHDIGSFEAEFLIDYLGKEIGSLFYNQGIKDACKMYTEKSEELGYLIQELEKVGA